jgi:hypothetical protein
MQWADSRNTAAYTTLSEADAGDLAPPTPTSPPKQLLCSRLHGPKLQQP